MERLSEKFRQQRFRRLGDLILEHHEAITEAWMDQADLEQPDADPDRRKEMCNSLPEHLKIIAANLDEVSDKARSEHLSTAVEHGRQRWHKHWSLAEVVRDFQVLRMVLLDFLVQKVGGPLEADEVQALNLSMDESIVLSVTAYVHASQELLEGVNAQLAAGNETLEHRVHERTIELRTMTTAIIEAVQKERRRIGRLLHDHLQQLLLAARWKLEEVLPSLDETSAAPVQAAHEYVGEAMESARTLAGELMPPVLTDEGLVSAIDWLAERFNKMGQLDVTVDADLPDDPTDPKASEFLYFCAHELLINAAKHSGSRHATIHLSEVERDGKLQIQLSVADGGTEPFSLDTAADNSGLGVAQMVATCHLYGGELQVVSTPEKGNEVVVIVPLDWAAT